MDLKTRIEVLPCGMCEEMMGCDTCLYSKEAHDLYYQIRAEVIEKCADKFADILSDMPNLCGTLCPVRCNWGTEESCKEMCKKWLLEQLKENK